MKEQWDHEKTVQSKPYLRVVVVFLITLLCISSLYWVGSKIESKSEKAEPRGDLSARFTEAPAIVFRGEKYQPKSELTTILIIGVDQYNSASVHESYFHNGGQADYLMLLVVNDESQTITPIQIDRDTMAEVTTLGVLGNVTGTRKTQVCLSHGFGDGGEQSCQLTRDAVSRLLLGIEIQYYIAMDLNGITALNDALGGVTVTLEDDFTTLDPTMFKGAKLTLKGIQAEYFVRSRINIGIGTNESRMARQQVYWQGFSQILKIKLDSAGNSDFVGNLFDQISAYLITDMKRGKLINEVWNTRDYQQQRPIHPSGEYTIGSDGFTEFHVDETAMEDLVMSIFYSKVS